MKVAVVAPAAAHAWHEPSLVVQRFAGAIACHAEVDLLTPGAVDRRGVDGAVTTLQFRSTLPSAERAEVVRELVLGPDRSRGSASCSCSDAVLRRAALDLPPAAQAEIVQASGSRSPGLLEHLLSTAYDLVVLCDYAAPVVHDVVQVLPDDTPVLLLPLAAPSPFLALGVHDAVFERATAVVVVSEGERIRVQGRPTRPSSPIYDLRFVLQVHDLVWKNEPITFERTPTVVIPRVWRPGAKTDELVQLARHLERVFEGELRIRLVGPGWRDLPGDLHGPFADSRFDVWRWCCRALAVLDADPGKLVGRESLEAMMYATPIVTPHAPGASLEHAQAGSAGLWYRTRDELEAVLGALLDPAIRAPLGEQAKGYAQSLYCDSDAYVDGVGRVLQELAPVA